MIMRRRAIPGQGGNICNLGRREPRNPPPEIKTGITFAFWPDLQSTLSREWHPWSVS